MKTVHITKEFWWVPLDNPQITIRYDAGMLVEVEELCALQAIASGHAVLEDVLFIEHELTEPEPLFDPDYEVKDVEDLFDVNAELPSVAPLFDPLIVGDED